MAGICQPDPWAADPPSRSTDISGSAPPQHGPAAAAAQLHNQKTSLLAEAVVVASSGEAAAMAAAAADATVAAAATARLEQWRPANLRFHVDLPDEPPHPPPPATGGDGGCGLEHSGPFGTEAGVAVDGAVAGRDTAGGKRLCGPGQQVATFNIAACSHLPCGGARQLAAALAALHSSLRDGGELFCRALLCNCRLEPGLAAEELEQLV
ncbi:hypothetical protein HYH02_013431 [Chlamydomonas schloesseri]|uniref:Uncharacterized protein n=1 Tax=Chlamydomonas schloesseri TaxID=2026947 RepID=A0A835T3T7_9CHLO|nr:hypothetical protein HYH02_013431 [Chlamydomonas schloesseri]|eukprot:KAG2431300.1 hypothetical protein HYH02_013431 [Chlamydomonas schloesseri]